MLKFEITFITGEIIMHKHYKIVSIPRFITFIIICIVIITFIATVFIKGTKEASQSKIETYKNIHIVSGDTLWNISKNCSSSKTDVRETIYNICKINDISAGEINPRDMIIVPEYT